MTPKNPVKTSTKIPNGTAKQRYDVRQRWHERLKNLPKELDVLLTSPDFVEFSKSHLAELKQLKDVLEYRIFQFESGLEYYQAIYEIKGRDLFYMRLEHFSYRKPGDVGALNPDEIREADIYHPDLSHIKAQLQTANVTPEHRRLVRKAIKAGFEFPELPNPKHLDDIQKYLKTK